MKKKPNKALFSEYHDYDEKLLFATRAGNFCAGNELLKRFFDIRYLVGRSVSPTIVKLLDSWELNHAFFDAYNNTCKAYKHYHGASVRTYFSTLMKHALIAEASSNQVFQRVHTLSLDEEINSKEGSEYCLNDIVPADEDAYSDVTYYMNYMESIERFLKKDFGLTELDKAIVRLRADGLSYDDVAKTLSIPLSRARSGYHKFYEAALKTIKTSSIEKIKKDLDELL